MCPMASQSYVCDLTNSQNWPKKPILNIKQFSQIPLLTSSYASLVLRYYVILFSLISFCMIWLIQLPPWKTSSQLRFSFRFRQFIREILRNLNWWPRRDSKTHPKKKLSTNFISLSRKPLSFPPFSKKSVWKRTKKRRRAKKSKKQ